jgi:poly-gamma-glutamate synthesis protein (capsule biosynthesis protein)
VRPAAAPHHALGRRPDVGLRDFDGAGGNIAEARKPAILERNGTRVGVLAYLSIVYPGLVADDEIPGCAPLRASHEYRQIDSQPGTPPLIVTALLPEDRTAMEEDIRKLRSQVDVVIVSMHAGVHYVPAHVAMYQKEAAYHAIDAGADLVLQHHAHIMKGVEVYQGKTIFYGLGNFAVEHSVKARRKPLGRSASTPTLRKFYKVTPIPGWEKFHYLADARMTMITKTYIRNRRIDRVTYVPAYINPDLEPEALARKDPRAQEVYDYVQRISDSEALSVRFSWDGDEVQVSAA